MADLIILPGLDGTANLHGAFKAAVAPEFESVVVVNYPADRFLDYGALEAWVRPLLPTVRPFWLLGESFSGPVAIAIAASPPPNLLGLILTTTFASVAVPWAKPFAPLIRAVPMWLAPMPLLCWQLLGRWKTKALVDMLRAALSKVAPAVLQARAAMTLRVDVTSLLASISVPVLYIRATEDRLLPAYAHAPITRAVKHARVESIEGPHLLLQASPVECARVIARFVSSE
jgi:pimeloyl-ACP methyl ester carboxylesterase